MGIEGLQFQNVDVKFTDGLDTKTQSKLVLPGKWLELNNATLADDFTPKRRDGINALVTSATTGSGNGLATFNDELLTINGQTVKSVSLATTPATLTAVAGELGYVKVAADDIVFPPAQGGVIPQSVQDSIDSAYGAGYTCYVWRDPLNENLVVSLVDTVTGDTIQGPVMIASGVNIRCPRVVFSFDSFLIFYTIAGADLFCRVIQVAAPTVMGAQTALITSASLPNQNFDVIDFGRIGFACSAMVVYKWADGTTSVRTIRVTQTAGTPAIVDGPNNIFTQVELPNAQITGLCIQLFDTLNAAVFTLAVAPGAMTGTAGRPIDIHGAPTFAATLLDVTAAATNAPSSITATNAGTGNSDLRLYWDRRSERGVVGLHPIFTMVVAPGVAIVSAATTFTNSAGFRVNAAEASGPTGPWIYGKAFTLGSRLFLPTVILEQYGATGANVVTASEQNTLFLLDGASAVVVAKAFYQSFTPALTASTPSSTYQISGGVFGLGATRRADVELFNGANTSSSGIVSLTFTPNMATAPVVHQLGQTTYLAGGSTTAYAGVEVTELGFPLFPEGISMVVVGGGGTMTAGVHQVVAVYEWHDSSGHRHQSAPSLAVSATFALNDMMTVIVPALLISQKNSITVVLYCTLANGVTFYRLQSRQNSIATLPPAFSVVTFTNVTSPDATLGANEILYTQPDQAGFVLPNLAPGPSNVLASHQNRLFLDVADAPNQYRFSQEYVPTVGLQFNDALGGTVDVSAGGIVGMSPLDEKLIIFGRRKPFAVFGTGPTPSGGFSNYSAPQEIPSDVGCTEPLSILRIPNGVMFKSAKGWYLLGRDLQVRYIGDGVKAYDGNDVTSAVLLEDQQECRFSSSSGTQLIYDYLKDQWSTTVYRVSNGASPVTTLAIASAVWWATGGYYASISRVNGLNKDVPGLFTDAPAGATTTLPIITTGRSAWLKLSVLNGYQRVRWLYISGTYGAAGADSSFTVDVNYDYADTGAPGAYSFNVASTAAIRQFATAPFAIRSKLRRQKCEAIAFTFTDTPTAAHPEGVSLQGITLNIGIKRGTSKLPAAQSVG